MTYALGLMAAVAAPGIVFGEDEPPPPQAASADVKPGATKLICKKEKVLGSNIKKRTCRTQAQIDALRAASQEHMSEVRILGTGSINPGD